MVGRDLGRGVVALRPRSWLRELSYWAVMAFAVVAILFLS